MPRPEATSSTMKVTWLERAAIAGVKPAEAKQDSETVFAFEKRLAEASLDNVALRDPRQQDHKTTFAELAKLAVYGTGARALITSAIDALG